MLITYLPILVALIGLLVYALASNPKASEIGRLLFFAGALAECFALIGHTAHLG